MDPLPSDDAVYHNKAHHIDTKKRPSSPFWQLQSMLLCKYKQSKETEEEHLPHSNALPQSNDRAMDQDKELEKSRPPAVIMNTGIE